MSLEPSLVQCSMAHVQLEVELSIRGLSSTTSSEFLANHIGEVRIKKDEGKKNRGWEKETLSARNSFINLTDY